MGELVQELVGLSFFRVGGSMGGMCIIRNFRICGPSDLG